MPVHAAAQPGTRRPASGAASPLLPGLTVYVAGVLALLVAVVATTVLVAVLAAAVVVAVLAVVLAVVDRQVAARWCTTARGIVNGGLHLARCDWVAQSSSFRIEPSWPDPSLAPARTPDCTR